MNNERTQVAVTPQLNGGASNSWRASVEEQTDEAFASMRRNAWLNFAVRAALYLFSLTALGFALEYTVRHGDDMVGVLLDSGSLDQGFNEDRLLALVIPAALLLTLAIVVLSAALLIQARGLKDSEEGLHAISRLRREAQAGVSRTRPLAHILEEFVSNARSAFRLQLWLSRTFFVVCVVLLIAAVANSIVTGVNIGTLVLAAGSLVSLLLGKLSVAAEDVGDRLGDATQLQLVVASATRQIDVLEEFMYKVLEDHRHADGTPRDIQVVKAILEAEVAKVSEITRRSVRLIQVYAEPAGKVAEELDKVLDADLIGSQPPGQ